MAPDKDDFLTDAGFADFLGKIVAQPKYGYGPIVALRTQSGQVTKFLKLDPSNDPRAKPQAMPSELADE